MNRNRVAAEFVLPCGHVLQAAWGQHFMSSIATDPATQPENYRDQLIAATDMLAGWLEARAARHICQLVTDDNPHGLPRTS